MTIRPLIVLALALPLGPNAFAADPAEHRLSDTMISAKLPKGYETSATKTAINLRKKGTVSQVFVSLTDRSKLELSDFRNLARVAWEGKLAGHDTLVDTHTPDPFAETFEQPVVGYKIWMNSVNEKKWFGTVLMHGPAPVMTTVVAEDAETFKILVDWSKTVRFKSATKQ